MGFDATPKTKHILLYFGLSRMYGQIKMKLFITQCLEKIEENSINKIQITTIHLYSCITVSTTVHLMTILAKQKIFPSNDPLTKHKFLHNDWAYHTGTPSWGRYTVHCYYYRLGKHTI